MLTTSCISPRTIAMSLSLWNQRAHLDIETSQQLSTFAVLVHGKCEQVLH